MSGDNGLKRENFKRLAAQRVSKIIKTLELLGNCSNKSVYDYTKEDVKKMFDAIDTALKETKKKYDKKTIKKDTSFKFDG